MFSQFESRKRPLQLQVHSGDETVIKTTPLKGAVICLSGLDQQEKDRLHEVIERLGGRYTRDLNLEQTSHLITTTCQGPKCEAAMDFQNIHIVQPGWLESCAQKRLWVDEKPFSLRQSIEPLPTLSLEHALEQKLAGGVHENFYLFSGCCFVLLGFSDEENLQLGKLIRRGQGMIYWQMQEGVSHVIVKDNSVGQESIRDLLLNIDSSKPQLVSPGWIFSCWAEKQLIACLPYPPKYLRKKKGLQPTNKKTKHTINFFRENLFILIRVAPPKWAVDFSMTQLETLITAHGGHILSSKLVDALRADQKAGRAIRRRNCHVVGWGSYEPGNLIDPLVSQVKRHQLCNLLEVSPIWVQTCVKELKYLPPSAYPKLFTPSSRLWHFALAAGDKNEKPKSVTIPSDNNSASAHATIRISITGFTGFERTALVQFIQCIGGTYDDSMRTKTTHLICREARGNKFEKAVEWKRHVLTVDWLYHIASEGYSEGCETRFSFLNATENSRATEKEA